MRTIADFKLFRTLVTVNNESTETLLAAVKADASDLAVMAQQGILRPISDVATDYPRLLRKRRAKFDPYKMINNLSSGKGIIHPDTPHPFLKEAFVHAHIAACCHLFQDLPMPPLHEPITFTQSIVGTIRQLMAQGQMTPKELSKRIHTADAARTMFILRMLGLIGKPAQAFSQISLAAGPGNRDVEGLHGIPSIARQHDGSIRFHLKPQSPKNVVLIDNDPNLKTHYFRLNTTEGRWMLALNESATEALAHLPTDLEERRWNSRNLVVGIRIDHRMIPDAAEFLELLEPVLDHKADFVFSIGAGHSLEEFSGRLNALDRLFNHFTIRGLKPVRILLHEDGPPEHQRISPSFGLSPYTTYEILYCKLDRDKLFGKQAS